MNWSNILNEEQWRNIHILYLRCFSFVPGIKMKSYGQFRRFEIIEKKVEKYFFEISILFKPSGCILKNLFFSSKQLFSFLFWTYPSYWTEYIYCKYILGNFYIRKINNIYHLHSYLYLYLYLYTGRNEYLNLILLTSNSTSYNIFSGQYSF